MFGFIGKLKSFHAHIDKSSSSTLSLPGLADPPPLLLQFRSSPRPLCKYKLYFAPSSRIFVFMLKNKRMWLFFFSSSRDVARNLPELGKKRGQTWRLRKTPHLPAASRPDKLWHILPTASKILDTTICTKPPVYLLDFFSKLGSQVDGVIDWETWGGELESW